MPHNVEFPISSLRAGRKTWFAGVSGPHVALVDSIFQVRTPKYQKEVILLGKILGECFIFESHKVDYSPASVRNLLKRERQLQQGQLSPSDGNSSSGPESNEDLERRRHQNEMLSVEMFDAFKAFDLAPRRSIHIRFKDVVSIEASGDTMTLALSRPPQCYAKLAGKPGKIIVDAVRDFTDGAKTISVKATRSADIRHILTLQCPRIEALFSSKAPSTPIAVSDAATPTRKRERVRSATPPSNSADAGTVEIQCEDHDAGVGGGDIVTVGSKAGLKPRIKRGSYKRPRRGASLAGKEKTFRGNLSHWFMPGSRIRSLGVAS